MPEWAEVALRIVHVLAAAVWIGGTVILVFVAVPYARSLTGELRAQALAALGRGWRPLGSRAPQEAQRGSPMLREVLYSLHPNVHWKTTPFDFSWQACFRSLPE